MNLNDQLGGWTAGPPMTASPWVQYGKVSLDGLSDKEFQYRYDIACQNRRTGDGALSMMQLHNMVMELASWPRESWASLRSQTRPQETQRDRMDYADWLKLLHEVTYKPGWHIEFVGPDHSHPWATISLCVSVWTNASNGNPRKIKKKYPMCEEMLDKMKHSHAYRIIDELITECELAIKDVWLKHNGEKTT